MERFDLPEGWEWRVMGELGTLLCGQSPSSETVNSVGHGTLYITGPEQWDGERMHKPKWTTDPKRVVPDGCVFITVKGAGVGKIFPGTAAAIGRDVYAFKPTDSHSSKFVELALRSSVSRVLLHASGDIPGLSKKHILQHEIAVPSLKEQGRLVARIEAQTSRVEAMRKAQHELIDDMRGTLAGYYAEITADAEWKPLGEVAPQARRPVTVQSGQSYPELGIRSFGKGTFHKPAISAEQLGSKRLYHILPGDLIFNNVFAWEGAVAVVKPEDAGRVGSHRFITCVPKPGVATTPFLYFHFTTEQGLHDLGDASPGGAGRNRTLGLKNLAAIRVPVPSHAKQVVFARLWDKVETTRRLQAELKADLAAYVPSILAKAFRGEL